MKRILLLSIIAISFLFSGCYKIDLGVSFTKGTSDLKGNGYYVFDVETESSPENITEELINKYYNEEYVYIFSKCLIIKHNNNFIGCRDYMIYNYPILDGNGSENYTELTTYIGDYTNVSEYIFYKKTENILISYKSPFRSYLKNQGLKTYKIYIKTDKYVNEHEHINDTGNGNSGNKDYSKSHRCGHRTQKGGSCKRKVIGYRYCWQHR